VRTQGQGLWNRDDQFGDGGLLHIHRLCAQFHGVTSCVCIESLAVEHDHLTVLAQKGEHSVVALDDQVPRSHSWRADDDIVLARSADGDHLFRQLIGQLAAAASFNCQDHHRAVPPALNMSTHLGVCLSR